MKRLKKYIKENFDKNNFTIFSRFSILILIAAITFNLLTFTLSRFESETNLNISPRLALFITEVGTYEGTIELDRLLPRTAPYHYVFTVANFKDDDKANVNIQYELTIITTTNMPLTFKLYQNAVNGTNGIVTSDVIAPNSDGMFFKTMKTGVTYNFPYTTKTTHTYVLYVEFPEVYKNQPDSYEGVVDLVEIKVDAKQKM